MQSMCVLSLIRGMMVGIELPILQKDQFMIVFDLVILRISIAFKW